MPASRRPLVFRSIDRVMPEVDVLLLGHETTGRWTLAQICNHLTRTIVGTVDGFPPGVRATWVVRALLGPIVLRRVLKTGRMAAGIPAPKAIVPPSDLDPRAEAEALRAAINILAGYSGPPLPHPFAGRITADDARLLTAIHAAHHLSFVRPTTEG